MLSSSTLRACHSYSHHHAGRRQQCLLYRLLSGGYSRMLDMGGAPSALHDKKNATTRINASKNCKLQAICFDFDVLSKYTTQPTSPMAAEEDKHDNKLAKDVAPDASMVQQVANLLNVNLAGGLASTGNNSNNNNKKEFQDDLSLLTGDATTSTLQKHKTVGDIRAKYADKLSKRGVQGGLAQVELAKYQVEETLKRGDAGGHLAARKIVASQPPPVGATNRQPQWMAQTGTGALLEYLTQRSIHIVLLPRPVVGENKKDDDDDHDEMGERMEDLQRQLSHHVTFTQLFKDGRPGVTNLVQSALTKLALDPHVVLLVSDRDDYLRAAKDARMMTCRIVPPNARRGNVSAHFMVPTLPEVQDVVNEINGISYNAMFKSR